MMSKNRTLRFVPLVMAAMALAPNLRGSEVARPGNWKDMDVDKKVEWLLSQMTLEEKIDQMHVQPRKEKKIKGLGMMSQPWNERLSIPPILCADGPRGPRSTGPIPKENRVVKNRNRGATSPTALCFASTWNSEIAYEAGRQWGLLTKEFGLNVLYTPGVNIVKDPRAGRNNEYAGEDPLHTGKIGAGITKGLQSVGVGACAKHFIVNNWESGRTAHDVKVPPRSLREIYLPAFRICVEEANVWSMMTSYNKANGEWCGSNKKAMIDIARNEWGYDGFFVSDWGAGAAPAEIMIKAGMNLELPGNKRMRHVMVKGAIKAGRLTENDVDKRVGELLRVKLKYLTYFGEDTPSGYDRKEFEKMMYNAAVEGAVLLKNKNNTLPLSPKASVALIGPFAADEKLTVANNGSSTVRPDYVVTVEKALKERGITVRTEKGCGANFYDDAKFKQDFPCNVEIFNNSELKGKPVGIKKMPRVTLDTVHAEGKVKPTKGVKGNGYRASGVDARNLGRISDADAWTMAVWVNLDDQFPSGFIMDLGNKTSSIEIKGSTLEVQEKGKKKQKKAVIWRNKNQRWLPVVVTFENNKVKLYRNGDLISEMDTNDVMSGLNLYVGASKNNTLPLLMVTDEFMAWDRVLTSKQIAALSDKKFDAVPKPNRTVDFENDDLSQKGIAGLTSKKNMSARITSTFTPEKAGKVGFKIDSNAAIRVRVNGELVLDLWDSKAGKGRYIELWHVFKNTKPHQISVEVSSVNRVEPFMKLEHCPPAPENMFDAAREAAKKSDIAVLCVGVTPADHQGEGIDRGTFKLPSWQDELIKAVQKVNPKTVVLLFTAGGVDVRPWENDASAIMEVYHMGSEAGNAISALLYGDANPSGKLTITWPEKVEDLPYTGPQPNYRNTINEFGYRYFDEKNIKVQYPFGYGLSYTNFDFGKLSIVKTGDKKHPVTAEVTVKNTGKVAGKEVVQVYVTDVASSVEQSKKEFAGFVKVDLKPGETKTVKVPLHWTAFEFFDVKLGKWKLESGDFIIRAGGSSAALPLEKKIRL